MLIVKIMSDEDTADTDPRKSFQLHAGVATAIFERRGNGTSEDPRTFTQPWLTLIFADKALSAESFEPRGNVYVMNEGGKTIASYGVAPIVYADALPDEGTSYGPDDTPKHDSGVFTRLAQAAAAIARFDPDLSLRLKGGYAAGTGGVHVETVVDVLFEVMARQIVEPDLKAMTERFLRWPLPKGFNPDGGISFDAGRVHPNHWPSGTNLFDYEQAKAMLAHVLDLTDEA